MLFFWFWVIGGFVGLVFLGKIFFLLFCLLGLLFFFDVDVIELGDVGFVVVFWFLFRLVELFGSRVNGVFLIKLFLSMCLLFGV